MQACVQRGFAAEGILPGVLKVPRRAPRPEARTRRRRRRKDPLDRDGLGERLGARGERGECRRRQVVTAPTNGAAGIVPAVLHYYARLVAGGDDAGVATLPAHRAARSVSSTSATPRSPAPKWAARARSASPARWRRRDSRAALGGTNAQVENAAEIGMEHNLGLTCDPIGGLVQIPCIERNAMGAVKAINAARLALRGDGTHKVSLDQVIATMRQTG